jgi:hypothetical protein
VQIPHIIRLEFGVEFVIIAFDHYGGWGIGGGDALGDHFFVWVNLLQ